MGIGGRDIARSVGKAGAALSRCRCGVPVSGRTGFRAAENTPHQKNRRYTVLAISGRIQRPASPDDWFNALDKEADVARDRRPEAGPTCARDSRPVTMACENRGGERGPGGASLAPSPGPLRGASGGSGRATSPRRSGRRDRRPAATGCSDCFTPQTSTSAHATPTSAKPRQPSVSASSRRSGPPSRPRDRREGRPRPDRGRPVRLQHPAEALGRPRRRGAEAARGDEDPDGHHPGHARLLRARLDLPRLRPQGAWPAARPTTTS